MKVALAFSIKTILTFRTKSLIMLYSFFDPNIKGKENTVLIKILKPFFLSNFFLCKHVNLFPEYFLMQFIIVSELTNPWHWRSYYRCVTSKLNVMGDTPISFNEVEIKSCFTPIHNFLLSFLTCTREGPTVQQLPTMIQHWSDSAENESVLGTSYLKLWISGIDRFSFPAWTFLFCYKKM